LPEVKSRIPLSEVRSSDTPRKGEYSSSTNSEGEGPRHVACGVGRLHVAKIKISGCAVLSRVKASQAGTCDTQQLGNVRTTKTGISKRPRPEGSTPNEIIRPSKRPSDYTGPETYKKALTNIKITIVVPLMGANDCTHPYWTSVNIVLPFQEIILA
jgi:hypothetical protein